MQNEDYITISRSELQEIVRQAVAAAQAPKWVSGIDGLCQIFGCSRSTAKRIKAGGTINKAIRQQGRTFVTNVDLALQLYGARNSRTIS